MATREQNKTLALEMAYCAMGVCTGICLGVLILESRMENHAASLGHASYATATNGAAIFQWNTNGFPPLASETERGQ